MPFNGILPLAQAVAENGREWQSFFFKTSVPAAGAGRWADASVGAGIPIYNAYVGTQLEAAVLTGAGNRGLYAGPEPASGQEKYIHSLQAVSTSAGVPVYMLLADYLLFYPLIDGDSTDTQFLDNTQTLTRYTTGDGVRCMFVVQTPMATFGTVTMTYTNSAGVSGRSVTFGINAAAAIGSVVNNSASTNSANAEAPFVPLASGDKGIRSIESITVSGAPGGFLNAVLVKPLAHLQLREQGVAAEKIMVPQSATCPKVESGAYLNWIINNASATAPTLRGVVQFAWS